MPVTNPADISNELEKEFNKSKYCKSQNKNTEMQD